MLAPGLEDHHEGVVHRRIPGAPPCHGRPRVAPRGLEIAEFERDQGEGLVHRVEVGGDPAQALVDPPGRPQVAGPNGQGARGHEQGDVVAVAVDPVEGQGVGLLGAAGLGEDDHRGGHGGRRGPGRANGPAGGPGRIVRGVEAHEGGRRRQQQGWIAAGVDGGHDVPPAREGIAGGHRGPSPQQEVGGVAGRPMGATGLGAGLVGPAGAQVRLGEPRAQFRVVGIAAHGPLQQVHGLGHVAAGEGRPAAPLEVPGAAGRHEGGEAGGRGPVSPADHRSAPGPSTTRSPVAEASAAGGTCPSLASGRRRGAGGGSDSCHG